MVFNTSTTAWEYLINGSLIKAAYQAFNVPFAFHGTYNYPIGILFLIFMILLYIQSRNVALHFTVSIILFAIFFVWIPIIIKGIILTILILELAGIIYYWATKE